MNRLLTTYICLCVLYIMGYGQTSTVPPPYPVSVENMTVIDSAYLRILYALNAVDINDPKTYDDLQRLEIGRHITKYYSYYIFNSDSLVTEWGKKNRNAESVPLRLGAKGKDEDWSEYYYSEYFKDLLKNTLTEYARMPMMMTRANSYYIETIPIQDWTVHNEEQVILSYRCQKATCHFRGREYTAWFTIDIPVSNGPWKLGGLPGLILKAYDNDKRYIFECVRIEQIKQKYPIKIYDHYKENYIKKDRKDILKLQKAIHDDYTKVTNLKVLSGTFTKPTSYYQLELE